MRIGYKASAEQFGPRDLVEFAVRAEQLGFDSATVSDHFLPWRHDGGHAPFALAWLTAVGERTTTLTLGTSVLTPTFRYNPAVIAQAFATLALLYPDRVILGVGTGEALNEAAVSGPRLARVQGAVRPAARGHRADAPAVDRGRGHHDGDYYRPVGASIYDRPDRPVPVYVAAGGPVVAKYAGRAGDGFICTSGKGMELYTEQAAPGGQARAPRRPGETFDDIDRMIEIKLSYDRDPARRWRTPASGRRCR